MTTFTARRRMATTLTALFGALSIVLGLAGAGHAAARPTEAPRLGIYGEDIWVGGAGANCTGPIHVSVKTDPRQPGRVFATYQPGRFSRPCTLRVWANWGIQLPGHNWSPPLHVGPRGGAPVSKTLWTGPGLQGMGFGVAGPHKSVSYYLIVP